MSPNHTELEAALYFPKYYLGFSEGKILLEFVVISWFTNINVYL